MSEKPLQVQMLGTFSLRLGDKEINDGGNRSHKVWLLLAYMIYQRNRPVTNDELAALLWSEDDASVNPLNAMKTMFHRVRSSLDQLEAGAGHRYILRRKGSYVWNPDIPLELDVDRFEALCKKAESLAGGDNTDGLISAWTQAAALYHGDFLSRLDSASWVVPISAYYHQLYLQAVLGVIPLLEERGELARAVELCRQAVSIEPYNEELYHYLMRLLLAQGDQKAAVAIYEEMSELLFSNFGIMPSEASLDLYRQAIRTVNDRTVSPGIIMEQLREELKDDGALLCDYDFFKIIYHAMARAVERSGDAVHLALVTVSGKEGKELPKRSLDRVMDNLRDIVRSNLRRGDIATRCSVSQYLLMLPQANYENSCMVCRRLARSFARQYPHSPASLHTSVHPLEPLI